MKKNVLQTLGFPVGRTAKDFCFIKQKGRGHGSQVMAITQCETLVCFYQYLAGKVKFKFLRRQVSLFKIREKQWAVICIHGRTLS